MKKIPGRNAGVPLMNSIINQRGACLVAKYLMYVVNTKWFVSHCVNDILFIYFYPSVLLTRPCIACVN